MRVIIAGSRSLADPAFVSEAIRTSGFKVTEIVSGGARGIDRLAKAWAMQNDAAYKEFLPDWEKYGRGAGPVRNKCMAEYADALIAIWDGSSKGTGDMVAKALKLGLRIFVYNKGSGDAD